MNRTIYSNRNYPASSITNITSITHPPNRSEKLETDTMEMSINPGFPSNPNIMFTRVREIIGGNYSNRDPVILSSRRGVTPSNISSVITSVRWSEVPVQSNMKKVNVKRDQIQHSIFEECIPFHDDPYWKSIFQQAARNKFPKNFGYRNGCLTFRKKMGIISLPVPESPQYAVNTCISFFKKEGGLRSEIDLKNEQLLYSSQQPVNIRVDPNKKVLQNIMIPEYVTEISHRLNFDIKMSNTLTTIINSGLSTGHLKVSDFVIKNDRIEHINGLIIESEKTSSENNTCQIYLTQQRSGIDSIQPKEKGGKSTSKGFKNKTSDFIGSDEKIAVFHNNENIFFDRWRRVLGETGRKSKLEIESNTVSVAHPSNNSINTNDD